MTQNYRSLVDRRNIHQIVIALEPIDCIPVAIVVDDDQESAFGYYSMLSVLRRRDSEQFHKVRQRIHSISFADDSTCPGLQAADMIAYVARRFKVDMTTGEDADFDVFPATLYPNLTMGGLHQPKFYTEDILYTLARGTSVNLERLKHEE
jgi:hypothetical protein